MILIYFSKACYFWWPDISSKKLLNGQLSEQTSASAVAF
jgi:hypothetical protein